MTTANASLATGFTCCTSATAMNPPPSPASRRHPLLWFVIAIVLAGTAAVASLLPDHAADAADLGIQVELGDLLQGVGNSPSNSNPVSTQAGDIL